MSDFPLINGIPAYPSASPLQVAGLISTSNVVAPDYQLGTNGPLVKSSIAARAARQGLVADGSVATGTVSVPALGTGDFTALAWVMPMAFPASVFGQLNGVLDIPDATTMRVYDSTGPTSYNITIPAITTGKTYLFTWTRSGTTLTAYVNGVAAGTTTCAASLSVFNSIGSINGFNRLNGTFENGYLYNRALTAAEVVSLYEAGVPAGGDYGASGAPASNTSLITGANSDFSSDTGFWNQKVGGNSISGGVANLANGQYFGTNNLLLYAGKKYRVTVTLTLAGTGVLSVYDGTIYVALTSSAGTGTFEFTQKTNGGWLLFRIDGCAGTLDNLTFFPVGLLLAPDAAQAGNGLLWTDLSGNGAHIVLPISGVSWNVPGTGSTRVRTTTSTNGNQAILGTYSLANNTNILRVRARSRTGTPTVKLGFAAGGADIVAAVALNTNWKTLTVLSDTVNGGNAVLWTNSNSTDVVEWDIENEPLSF
jgi:hypothetical protein